MKRKYALILLSVLVFSFVFLSSQLKAADKALFCAISEQNLEQVKILLNKKNIDLKDEDEDTALQMAFYTKNKKIIRYIIEQGASLKSFNPSTYPYSFQAVRLGYIKIYELLLKRGDEKKHLGDPIFFYAGNLKMLKYLLSKGAKLSSEENMGNIIDFHAESLGIELANLYSKVEQVDRERIRNLKELILYSAKNKVPFKIKEVKKTIMQNYKDKINYLKVDNKNLKSNDAAFKKEMDRFCKELQKIKRKNR